MADPMQTYEAIKRIGPEAEAEAVAFMNSLTSKYTEDNPAPKDVIQQGLEGIVRKHKPAAIAGTQTSVQSPSRIHYGAGLAAVIAGIAYLAGIPLPPVY